MIKRLRSDPSQPFLELNDNQLKTAVERVMVDLVKKYQELEDKATLNSFEILKINYKPSTRSIAGEKEKEEAIRAFNTKALLSVEAISIAKLNYLKKQNDIALIRLDDEEIKEAAESNLLRMSRKRTALGNVVVRRHTQPNQEESVDEAGCVEAEFEGDTVNDQNLESTSSATYPSRPSSSTPKMKSKKPNQSSTSSVTVADALMKFAENDKLKYENEAKKIKIEEEKIKIQKAKLQAKGISVSSDEETK